MKKINNKGFTLLEVLAVIVIIAVVGGIAAPNILGVINSSNTSSYNIMVQDIKTASITLFEEVENIESSIYQYDQNGATATKVTISNNKITVNLQTLVSNGFLTGTKPKEGSSNKNKKTIINPKDKKDIGDCEITITKTVNTNNYKVTYTITNNSTSNSSCPTTEEYS